MIVSELVLLSIYNEELKELNDYRINGYLYLIESLDSEIKDVQKDTDVG